MGGGAKKGYELTNVFITKLGTLFLLTNLISVFLYLLSAKSRNMRFHAFSNDLDFFAQSAIFNLMLNVSEI